MTPMARIENSNLLVRGQRVMIDTDLAQLYGVPTKALNQAVKRNVHRFPPDFMFQLTQAEKQEVVTNCDHLARLKFANTLPFAFTEHGAIQAANVLSSEQAVEMGVYVVRAFVRLREMIVSNKELALRQDDLENKTELMSLKHDTFEQNPRVNFIAVPAETIGLDSRGTLLRNAKPLLHLRRQPATWHAKAQSLRGKWATPIPHKAVFWQIARCIAKRKAPRYAVWRCRPGGRGRTSTQLATTSKPNTE
jgi:hypothetical protein